MHTIERLETIILKTPEILSKAAIFIRFFWFIQVRMVDNRW